MLFNWEEKKLISDILIFRTSFKIIKNMKSFRSRLKSGRFVSSQKCQRKQIFNTTLSDCLNTKVDISLPDLTNKTNETVGISSPPTGTNVNSQEEHCSWKYGRRIVELDHLAKQLKCKCCKTTLFLDNIVCENRHGFASSLTIGCEKCDFINIVTTGKTHRVSERGPPVFDVNTKAALGMIHSGTGHTQLSTFMATMEIPCLHHTTMKSRETEIAPHVEKVATMTCKEAIQEEINAHKENIRPDPTLQVHLPNSVPVTPDRVQGQFKYDMGWQKRGTGRAYDSKSGIGTMFGNKLGKICAFGIRSKDCRKCSFHINKGNTPPEHVCSKNWDGSSKAMEADVAVEAVKEIESHNQVDVSVLIMDDDATTMAKIKKTLSHTVTKWSDLNHTKKHLGNSLYHLQNTHKCLTTKVIKFIQKCFTYAVKQNTGDPIGLKAALLQIVPHAFGQHETCDRHWCGFHKNQDLYRHKSLPYGKDLTGEDLQADLSAVINVFVSNVEKIAPGASTKEVESFNNMMATKAPKRLHFSASKSLENRLHCAVAQKNVGTGYITQVNESLGISPGRVFRKVSDLREKKRKRRLKFENTKEFKKQRLEKKLKKYKSNSDKEFHEGITYKSGIDLTSVSDTTEIPEPTSCPCIEPLEHFDDCHQIYCDIETTSLAKSCDIVQLAAVCKNDAFNCYILPSKPISEGASKVTGLTFQGDVLFYNGNPLNAESLKESLALFLAWLQDRQPCILIGHNFKNFDMPRLLHAFEITNLLSSFEKCILGIVDTLPLFRALYPELQKHSQEFLIHNLLNQQYDAHNALADVKGLQDLIRVTKVTNEHLLKHSITSSSAVSIYNFDKKSREIEESLSILSQNKVLSAAMCRKTARSGLGFCHLKLIFSRGGFDGLYALLSERNNGKPRVTSVKKIVENLFNFLKNM